MIDGLKPYPEYRNSGLSWLGKVPAQGDCVQVDNAEVSVLSTLGRRVRKVRVVVTESPATNGKNGNGG